MIPQLLFDIAKCNNFISLLPAVRVHPCNQIVDYQRMQGAININDFQLPEPWSGDILSAPILFISSNPAYSFNELFPTILWPDPMIADFFINRFIDRGPIHSWVFGNKVLLRNGKRSQSVRYWASIRNRASELLGRNALPGIDYCLTELVHCKSVKEIGVRSALPECTQKYLNRKVVICGAKLIVGVGSYVKNYFGGIGSFGGIPIIYLPAPNSFSPHTFSGNYTVGQIKEMQITLAENLQRLNNIDFSAINLPSREEVAAFIDQQLSGIT